MAPLSHVLLLSILVLVQGLFVILTAKLLAIAKQDLSIFLSCIDFETSFFYML